MQKKSNVSVVCKGLELAFPAPPPFFHPFFLSLLCLLTRLASSNTLSCSQWKRFILENNFKGPFPCNIYILILDLHLKCVFIFLLELKHFWVWLNRFESDTQSGAGWFYLFIYLFHFFSETVIWNGWLWCAVLIFTKVSSLALYFSLHWNWAWGVQLSLTPSSEDAFDRFRKTTDGGRWFAGAPPTLSSTSLFALRKTQPTLAGRLSP